MDNVRIPSLVRCLFRVLIQLVLRTLAVAAMYAAGYYCMNPVWIIIAWGWFKYRDHKRLEKKFKQEAAKAIALRHDRKMVLSNVTPLPPWVYFPETERCEWINKVIGHLWPTVRSVFLDRVKTIFEPSLNEALSAYKKNPSFSFKKIGLGCESPRITGVKVYDKGGSDKIMVDIYIFFSSDSDITFSLMNAVGGIECFEIRGCLRTIIFIESSSEESFIAGVQFFFLRQPKIAFNLTGLLEVLDVPGVYGILRKTMDSKINELLVLPNNVFVKLDDRVDHEKFKFPNPVGLLRINVIEARSLQENERFLFSGTKKPDPYLTITFGSKILTSPIVENSKNPVWDFWADFVIDSFFDETVKISVTNRKENNNLGKVSIGLKLIKEKAKFDSWIQLEGVPTGMVHLRVCYYQLDNNPELLISDNEPVLLQILIKDAKNLVSSRNKLASTKKKLVSKKRKIRYSVAKVSVENVTQTSKPVSIENPVFGEILLFLVKNPKTEKLQVKLLDQTGETALGNMNFELKNVLEAHNMEIINEQSKLNGAGEKSSLSLSLRLRILKAAQNISDNMRVNGI